jgi:hypothetical protein
MTFFFHFDIDTILYIKKIKKFNDFKVKIGKNFILSRGWVGKTHEKHKHLAICQCSTLKRTVT